MLQDDGSWAMPCMVADNDQGFILCYNLLGHGSLRVASELCRTWGRVFPDRFAGLCQLNAMQWQLARSMLTARPGAMAMGLLLVFVDAVC